MEKVQIRINDISHVTPLSKNYSVQPKGSFSCSHAVSSTGTVAELINPSVMLGGLNFTDCPGWRNFRIKVPKIYS
jgi:hypothetical protein